MRCTTLQRAARLMCRESFRHIVLLLLAANLRRAVRGFVVPSSTIAPVESRLSRSPESALLWVRAFFIYDTPSSSRISAMPHAKRPLMRVGRSGPFSKQAHARNVCGRRFR